jgi:hypothetical protein
VRAAALVLLAILAVAFPAGGAQTGAAPTPLAEGAIELIRAAELRAVVAAQCRECAWETAGREAVTLVISVDGRYSQHLPLIRGTAEYSVMLGAADPGRHVVRAQVDPATTSSGLHGSGAATATIAVTPLYQDAAEHLAVALAPFVYARPNTVGRFTDVPALMWYEREATERGALYRYSVIFTNEDGGTPTDRLMATWGRTTDIEYVYSIEVDRAGVIVGEEYQGPEHKILPFRGRREGRHALLWVSTDNNMVRDTGDVPIRYAPAPQPAALEMVSREAVMDANPWLYAVMAQELRREGKVALTSSQGSPSPPPGQDTIADPRRFAYIEACGDVGNTAVAFEVHAGGEWVASDRGLSQYRITRDGCFRSATPLPASSDAMDVDAVRVRAYERPPVEGKPPVPPTGVRLTRINKVFLLDERYVPGPALLSWQGTVLIRAGGNPLEVTRR